MAMASVAGEPQSLLDAATEYLGGIEPLHYWDFTTNRALFSGTARGAIANTPGWAVTRAGGPFYAPNAAGILVPFDANTARITDAGLLIEASRTNLFLNSETGATQGITVAAAAHTLSFYGTGTITLTGTSTAGPLIGAGANNRVTLTFTPTAGALTCTVSGSCTRVQLEAGSFATSWIPTTGVSAARPADIVTISSPAVDYPLTLWAEFERLGDTGAAETILQSDDGTNNERGALRIGASDLLNAFMVDGAATQGDVSVAGSVAVSTNYKAAAAFGANRVQACRSGTLATEDATATAPATPSVLRFGSNAAGGQVGFLLLKRAAVFNAAISDANLQTVAP